MTGVAEWPQALDEALKDHYGITAGYRSPAESRRGLKARMGALERAYGTKRAAAAAVGINPTTWSRWTSKTQSPGAASLDRLESAYQGLLRAAKVQDKGGLTSLSVWADVAAVGPSQKYYNSVSYRKFKADRLMPRHLRDITTAFAAGRPVTAVADLASRMIERAYGRPFQFEGPRVVVDLY